MWFVLYLPVSLNVFPDSDEAELFICSSWSWYRRTLTPPWAELPALMWTCSGCKVRNFKWRCLIMQRHMQTCWISPAVHPPFISFFAFLRNNSLKHHGSSFRTVIPARIFPRLIDWCFYIPVASGFRLRLIDQNIYHLKYVLSTGALSDLMCNGCVMSGWKASHMPLNRCNKKSKRKGIVWVCIHVWFGWGLVGWAKPPLADDDIW